MELDGASAAGGHGGPADTSGQGDEASFGQRFAMRRERVEDAEAEPPAKRLNDGGLLVESWL
eukprot:4338454-Lingulodinium_polyedra.AAC.1